VLRREVVKPGSMSMVGWFFRGPSLPLFGCRCGAEILILGRSEDGAPTAVVTFVCQYS
jgi:hypothetical protein